MSLSSVQSIQRKQKLALTPQMRTIVEFLSRDTGDIAAEIFRLGRSNVSLGLAGAPEQEASGSGLYETVALRIASQFNDAERRVALCFLDALEPWGWLGKPLQDICATANVTETVGSSILKRLQKIEPAGLFARSLSECLLLQLHAEGPPDPLMGRVLENLPCLLEEGSEQMAQRCHCHPNDLSSRLERLRELDPKPGFQFEAAPKLPTQILIEEWRKHCNTKRPHSALGYRPPAPEAIVQMDQRPIMHYSTRPLTRGTLHHKCPENAKRGRVFVIQVLGRAL